jgi:hypothetical protein
MSTLGLSDILVRKCIRVNQVQGEEQREQKYVSGVEYLLKTSTVIGQYVYQI